MKKTNLIFSILIALLLIGGAFVLRPDAVSTVGVVVADAPQQNGALPEISFYGSEHAHSSLGIFIEGLPLNLQQRKYMVRADEVHLEDNNGVIVHKHAKGVTVPYFLSTIGIRMIQDCLTLDTGENYCADGDKTLRLIVNGSEIVNFIDYELREGDRILINYGNDNKTELGFKMNNIPVVPEELKL